MVSHIFFQDKNNIAPCPRKTKLSEKYTRYKFEIMLALFFDKSKSVDKLWCLWTNYGLNLQDIVPFEFFDVPSNSPWPTTFHILTTRKTIFIILGPQGPFGSF